MGDGREGSRADPAYNQLIEALVDMLEVANAAFERQLEARRIAENLTMGKGGSLQRVADETGLSLDSVEALISNTPMSLPRRLRMDEESIDVLLKRVAKRRRWDVYAAGTSMNRLHLDSVILRTLLTQAPIGFALLDPDLRYVLVNEALAEINGLTVNEHIGRTMLEVVPGLAEEAIEPFRRVLGSGEPLRNLRLTGRTASRPEIDRTWLESVYRVTDNTGVLGLAVVVIEDDGARRPFLD
jgi:PAS domain S-box-containing protein